MKVTKKRLLLLVLFLSLFTCAKFRLRSDLQTRGSLRTYDAPNSMFGYLTFGAFKPLFLNYLWSKADRLQREGRFWELIDVQERIMRLQPHDVLVRHRQVQLVAFGIGQSEPNDAKRWRYYRKALRKLGEGIKLNPKSYDLRELRYYIYYQLIANDDYCSRQLKISRGQTGLEKALAEAIALAQDFPNRTSALDIRIVTVSEACEWLFNRGRFLPAADLFDELAIMAREFEERFPHEYESGGWEETYRFWAKSLRRLAALATWKGENAPRIKDPEALEALLKDVGDRLESGAGLRFNPEFETLDAAIVNLIHLRAIGLWQASLVGKKTASSLRYRGQINRISLLAEDRIGPQMPYYSVAYVNLFEIFTATDAKYAAVLQAGEKDPGLEARWRDELRSLDRLFRKRAGRSDSFMKRLIQARR